MDRFHRVSDEDGLSGIGEGEFHQRIDGDRLCLDGIVAASVGHRPGSDDLAFSTRQEFGLAVGVVDGKLCRGMAVVGEIRHITRNRRVDVVRAVGIGTDSLGNRHGEARFVAVTTADAHRRVRIQRILTPVLNSVGTGYSPRAVVAYGVVLKGHGDDAGAILVQRLYVGRILQAALVRIGEAIVLTQDIVRPGTRQHGSRQVTAALKQLDGNVVSRTTVADGVVVGGTPSAVMVIVDCLVSVGDGHVAAVILKQGFNDIGGGSCGPLAEAGVLILIGRQCAARFEMRTVLVAASDAHIGQRGAGGVVDVVARIFHGVSLGDGP